MPFFLGAAGVLGMDGFMGVQFLVFGDDGDPHDYDHGHEHAHVDGREGELGEEDRPLVTQEGEGGKGRGRYGTV